MSFYFKIYNGLLDPKHVEAMGEAVWLYMWLQEKNTSINENGEGKVLGNRPIIWEVDIKPHLGVSQATYKRWVSKLRAADYIKTLRTPRGLIIVINKAKKFEPKSDSSFPPITTQKDEVIAHNRTSEGSNSYRDSSKSPIQYNNKQPKYNNKQSIVNHNAIDVVRIFDFYVTTFNSPTTKLSESRKAKIKARLKDAGEEMLKQAIINTSRSPHHTGDNERGWKANIDFIIRSYEQVERLSQLNVAGGSKTNSYKADW